MKWRTIDSAPKDGTFIFIFVDEEDCYCPMIARWNGEAWGDETGDFTVPGLNDPTHWQPLMAGPRGQTQHTQPSDEEPALAGDEVSAADQIARLTQENEDLRIRNLELEDAVAKMQDGIRAIQQHQTKRRK